MARRHHAVNKYTIKILKFKPLFFKKCLFFQFLLILYLKGWCKLCQITQTTTQTMLLTTLRTTLLTAQRTMLLTMLRTTLLIAQKTAVLTMQRTILLTRLQTTTKPYIAIF